jgi:hypothetical protein
MRTEILERTEAWVGDMSSETKRKEYTDEYLMEDGDFVYGPKELKTWLEANVPAVEYKVKREIVF